MSNRPRRAGFNFEGIECAIVGVVGFDFVFVESFETLLDRPVVELMFVEESRSMKEIIVHGTVGVHDRVDIHPRVDVHG
jgi:hypothetical protein